MKLIITESQNSRIWLLRRLYYVNVAFEETVKFIDPCGFGSFDKFEEYFLSFIVATIYMIFYDVEGLDYGGIMEDLSHMFHDKITELFYNKKC